MGALIGKAASTQRAKIAMAMILFLLCVCGFSFNKHMFVVLLIKLTARARKPLAFFHSFCEPVHNLETI